MLVRYINEKEIKSLKNVDFLTIDGKQHLIANVKNQPIELLNANRIYEYVDEIPEHNPNTHYLEPTYKLEENKVYSIYEIKELGEDG